MGGWVSCEMLHHQSFPFQDHSLPRAAVLEWTLAVLAKVWRAEGRMCLKCIREIQKPCRKLANLEGEMREKQLEMRGRVNGMRCETQAGRQLCFSGAFATTKCC